jgi:type IV pilus assembly protein PilB
MFGRRSSNEAGAAVKTASAPASASGTEQAADGFADDLESLWKPESGPVRKSIEQLLMERGHITEEQLTQARHVQTQTPGKSLTQILLTMSAASEAQILSALAETLGLEFETPERPNIDERAFELLAPEYIRKQLVLPMRLENDGATLVVGMSDPNNIFLLDEVKTKTRRRGGNGSALRVVVVTPADINKIVEQMTAQMSDVKVDELLQEVKDEDVQLVKEDAEDDAGDLARAGNESPIIKFVNYLISDAIRQGASDIHIEPKEKALKVRYRIDGILFEAMNPPHTMHGAMVSRLKIMANLDISERRLPQDGRIRAMVPSAL